MKKRLILFLAFVMAVTLFTGCTAEIEDIDLDEDQIELVVGETYKVDYDIEPRDAEGDLEWESDDEDIAVVSSRGKITAIGAGECTITVTADSGADAEIDVTVIPAITEEELQIVGTYDFDRGNLNDIYYGSYDYYAPNMTLQLYDDKTGVIYYNGSEYRSFTWEYDFTGEAGDLYFDAYLDDSDAYEWFCFDITDYELHYYFEDGDYVFFD